MKIFETHCGDSIKSVIKNMLEVSKERNELVICEFNGAIAQINKYMSEEECYNLWNEALKIQSLAYRRSNEYKQTEIKREQEKIKDKETYDNLMNDFGKIDFTNKLEVLNWLKCITLLTDNSTINDKNYIIKNKFLELGYKSNVNCGKDYIRGDIENNYQYLIGQVLNGLQQAGAIHPILTELIPKFLEEYYK